MKNIFMRVSSILILAVASSPVFATGEFNQVPAPGVLALVGAGALAVLIVKHFKK